MNDLEEKLRKLIIEINIYMSIDNKYNYILIPSISIIENMIININGSRKLRRQLTGALGRIITDDTEFMETHIGEKIGCITSEFYSIEDEFQEEQPL